MLFNNEFNEDSRVKIPAILHLCRMGFTYIPKNQQHRIEENNIFPIIFKKSITEINGISEQEAEVVLEEAGLKLYDWSERKHRYTRAQVMEGLQWIRENKLEPTGFGKLIKKTKSKK